MSWKDDGNWAEAVHTEAASDTADNTFVAAWKAFHILIGHERQSVESVLKRASLTVEFGSLIWAGTAAVQSQLASPCFRRVLG